MLLCRVTHSLNFSVVPKADLLYEFVALTSSRWQKVMPDDHSEVVPLLPIPNRTVKRFSADDSADSRVKVGHCQAIKVKTPSHSTGRFFWPFFWFLHQICDAAILDLAWPPTPCAHPISSVLDVFPLMCASLYLT